MSACLSLTKNLVPSCSSLKAIGGADRRIWIGAMDTFLNFTFVANTNVLDAFSLSSGKSLVRFFGKRLKNTANISLEDGENIVLRNHQVVFAAYAQTGEEKYAVDQLINQESVIVFVETNAGRIFCYGLAMPPYNPDNFGLKVTSGEGSIGTLINDPNVLTLTMSGMVPNLELEFKPDIPLEQRILTLDNNSLPLT